MSNDLPEDAEKTPDQPTLNHLLNRQRNILDDLHSLLQLLSRPRDDEWVSIPDISRKIWATMDTEETVFRLNTSREILADREWLSLLLESLFDNMLTHGCPNAIEIGIESERLYLADDGVGLPLFSHDHVLESGFTTRSDGSGFGFSVVRHVANAHGWGLRIQEGLDGGVSFEFSGVHLGENSA